MPRFAPRRAASAAILAAALVTASPRAAQAPSPIADVAAFLAPQQWRPLGPSTTRLATVTVDAAFPYRVCGTGIDGGVSCVSADGRPEAYIGERLGATPGTVAADPLDADVLFAFAGGRVQRYDRRTNQVQDVSPPFARGHGTATRAPLTFAPTDARTLYFGADQIWKTSNAGQAWIGISPDLSRSDSRAAISALGPSAVDGRVLWAGTTDGLVHATRDAGATWLDVTPPAIPAGWTVTAVEPSRFDPNTAYVSADGGGDGSVGPAIFRTRDSGVSWTRAVAGLPERAIVFAVREDMFRRGLLFAGTSAGVYLSFDDGDSWRPANLNLPAADVRDLAVKDSDVVIATSGHGFWMLEDITPLRQITADSARADVFLFRPAVAWRTAVADAGVRLSYFLGAPMREPMTIEVIATATGELIRRFDGDALGTTPGLHRTVWDLRYEAADGARGVAVLPGTYQVRLTAGARLLRQGVIVRMDPRVRTSSGDLQVQFKQSMSVDAALRRVNQALAARPAEVPIALQQSRALLVTVLARLQQSDTRPTAALEAAAAEAIAAADAALGRVAPP